MLPLCFIFLFMKISSQTPYIPFTREEDSTLAEILTLPNIERLSNQQLYESFLAAIEKADSASVQQALAMPKFVRALLAVPKIEINTRNENGLGVFESALIQAANNGHVEAIQALLDVPGIEVNARDKYSWSVLMLAANYGHTEAVKALLDVRDIEVNAQDKDDWSALMLAANNGHLEAVKALLDAQNIEIDAQDNNHQSALMLAADRGHVAVIKAFIDKLRKLKN